MRIGVAGIGSVGATVARALDNGEIQGCELGGIVARSPERADQFNARLKNTVPNLTFGEIADECEIVLEALPPSIFDLIAVPVLTRGRTLIAMSASQLLGRSDLVELARQHNGRVVVPSGAMLGLDALKAAAVGTLHVVTVVSRKPPRSLLAAPYVTRREMEMTEIREAVCLMKGSVSEIAREFPANVNVAAAVSLAGLGPERTKMEIWADPTLQFNTHTVSVRSDSSDFTMSIQNRPGDENPATGRITSQSVIAYLRQLNTTVRIGT